uniref:Uncharacterized protein n=1 Tax=Anguilla anguilla TaxID=7936 RepID=A0A0E9W444_ANGAN
MCTAAPLRNPARL